MSDILEKIGTPDTSNPSGYNASRAAHLDADVYRARKYDPDYAKDMKKSKQFKAIGGVVFSGGVILTKYVLALGIVVIVIGIVILLLGVLFKRDLKVFKHGLLIPCVAAEGPDVVLTMADLSYKEEPVFGVKKIRVGIGGDWCFRRGEKYACCTFFSSADEQRNIFKYYSPSFVPWVTGDRDILSACVNAIDDEEWDLLEKILPYADGLDMEAVYIVSENDGTYEFQKL